MKILVTETAVFIGFQLDPKLLKRDIENKVYTRDIFNSDN